MPAVSFFKKNGTMRIYSPAKTSTGGATPDKFIEVKFQNGNINFSMGPAFPSQELVLDRNTFTSDAHYIDVDDADVLTPLPLTFEFRGVDKHMQTQLRALSNPFSEGTATGWTVGNFIWNGFNEQSITRKNGKFANITIPEFALSGIQLVRTEVRLVHTSTEVAVQDAVFKFTGTHYPRDQIASVLSADALTITANGLIYGDVALTTAFSSGTQTDT